MEKIKLYELQKINSIQELVIKSAKEFGDKIALEDLNQTIIPRLTYKELLDLIYKFGTALKKLGIKERSHIAIIGENRVQWALAYLTCICYNYVAVPIDKNLTKNEILNIAHESDSEAVIFSDNFSEIWTETISTFKQLKHFICMDNLSNDDFLSMNQLINNSESYSDFPEINNKELAEIIFTSGSLGRAKGVMLSQKNLVSNLYDMLRMLKMYPEDRFLSVLPIHHTYEKTCGLLCPLYAGSSVHYSRSLKTIVDDLQKVNATILLGVPLLYDKMFKRISKAIADDKVKSVIVPLLSKITNVTEKLGWENSKKKIFKEIHKKFGGSIRLFIAGGAAPDPQVASGLIEFGFKFIQGYGLTETSPILTLNRIDNFKNDAAGLPLPSVELKINTPNKNGIGEIWAKGPNVMLGYYKNQEQTESVFQDGWFKTGDVGYIDQDGFLHIKGREKNVIISKSGENVFPEEIEDEINKSPFVLECVVFGENDVKHDEIIAAQIVVDAEEFIKISEQKKIKITDELIENTISDEIKRINRKLAGFKQIRKYTIRKEEFVKTTTQKIKRHLINT